MMRPSSTRSAATPRSGGGTPRSTTSRLSRSSTGSGSLRSPRPATSPSGASRNGGGVAPREMRRRVSSNYRASEDEVGVRILGFVRVRPMFESERQVEDRMIVQTEDDKDIIRFTNTIGTRLYQEEHEFDGVFGMETPQDGVYRGCVSSLVQDVCEGLNCAVFAYGQTSAGKTHTMIGDLDNAADAGMIPRAVEELFTIMRNSGREFKVSISMVEIYNESLSDMFVPAEESGGKPVRLEEDPKRGGTFCRNVFEIPVDSAEDVAAQLKAAEARARVAETTQNKLSSRSHRVFMLINEFKEQSSGTTRVGRLTMVDLAGSEAFSPKKMDAARIREMRTINQSTLTLGRVIHALTEKKTGRIPYRDSKLTRLVGETLGGYCKTHFVFCLSPAASCEEETQTTIAYGKRARLIMNKPQVDALSLLRKQLIEMREYYERRLAIEKAKYAALLEKLSLVRLMRDKLLDAHSEYESTLKGEADAVRDALEDALEEIDMLFTEIGRKRDLSNSNERAVDEFGEDGQARFNDLGDSLKDFEKMHKDEADKLKQQLEDFINARARDVDAINNRLKVASKLLDAHNEETNSQHKEQIQKLREQVGDVKTSQEEYVSKAADATTAGKKAVNEQVERLQGELEALIEECGTWKQAMLDGIAEHSAKADGFVTDMNSKMADLRSTMDKLSEQHVNNLAAHKSSVDKFAEEERRIAKENETQLLRQITELVQANTRHQMERLDAGVSKFHDEIDDLRDEAVHMFSEVATRTDKATKAANDYRTAEKAQGDKMREATDRHYKASSDAARSAISRSDDVRNKSNANADAMLELIKANNTELARALDAVSEATHDIHDSLASRLADNSMTVKKCHDGVSKELHTQAEQFADEVQKSKDSVDSLSKEVAAWKQKTDSAYSDFRQALDAFVNDKFMRDTMEDPAPGVYEYPKEWSEMPSYYDVLPDYAPAWAEEEMARNVQNLPPGSTTTTLGLRTPVPIPEGMTEEELKGLEGKEAEYELQEKEVVNVTETTGVKRQFFVTETVDVQELKAAPGAGEVNKVVDYPEAVKDDASATESDGKKKVRRVRKPGSTKGDKKKLWV